MAENPAISVIVPTQMKLLAITVMYHPDEEAFCNIGRYIEDVDHLMIWDNTPDADSLENIKNKILNLYPPRCSKLHFASTGRNEGLSFAYNRAIEYAKAHGYTHLMTMDQDSKWENFKEYKQECKNQFVKYNNAIIGPCINDIKREKTIKLVPHVINSGLIIPISTINRIGMYSERFIIDAIDVELCFRANSNNIPTFIIAGNWGLIQKFGNQSFFQLRGSQRVSYNYSPYRLYGIIRNHILLTRMYPEQKANIVRTYKVYLKEFAVSIIFSENNKIIKLKAMVKGLLNGLTTRKSVESKYSKA